MKLGQNCIDIIKHYEGFRAKPYICPAGKPTIGYGSTYYPGGKKVKLSDPEISETKASEFLLHNLVHIDHDLDYLLKVEVKQYQRDALGSFAYNLGSDIDADNIAEGLGDSTLLRLINNGIIEKEPNWRKIMAAEFNKWVKATVHGEFKTVPGLVARRNTEAYLCCNNIVIYFKK